MTDRPTLEINPRCQLIDIPEQAHEHTVSGRTLESERIKVADPVSVEDLERFAVLAQDLADSAVMSSAWS